MDQAWMSSTYYGRADNFAQRCCCADSHTIFGFLNSSQLGYSPKADDSLRLQDSIPEVQEQIGPAGKNRGPWSQVGQQL
jgi:hypothetical protein